MNPVAASVCLLGPPRFAGADASPWPAERRWRLAALLALAEAPVHRDGLAEIEVLTADLSRVKDTERVAKRLAGTNEPLACRR